MVAETKYKVADLDVMLVRNLMNDIDYAYRFREDKDLSLKDIVDSIKPELDKSVAKFYDGIAGLNIELSADDYIREYENTMM